MNNKILWLEVLVGKARKAWNRLPEDSKGNYNLAKEALRKRFEPDSCADLYAAEFQTRRKRQDETWGDLADNLRTLAERAFPELDERAKEKLSVYRFLSLLHRSDVALAVRQKKPKCIDDTVTATLEIESILALSSSRGFTLFTTFHDPHNCVHGTGSRVIRRYTTSCFVHVIMHWEGLLQR